MAPRKDRKTVADYVAGLEPHAAEVIAQLRDTMRTVAPDVEESISYDIVLFKYSGAYLYAGAWNKHIGIYPVYPAPDAALEADIAPYRSGKDTVQFKYGKPIPYDLIARIAAARIGAG